MIRLFRSTVRSDREGQTLAVVAVSMVALLAIMSLGIDLGMAYTARAEAQRVADSSALAGASVFLDLPAPADPVAAADARARQFAAMNVVRNRPVDPIEDVEVQVLSDEEKVRVWVRRTGLPAWFSRFIGQNTLSVRAMAAAQAMNEGTTDCLKPWAVVDGFLRKDGEGQELVPEDGERYDPDVHEYDPSDKVCGGGTGYGADTPRHTKCDLGFQLTIKSQRPNEDAVPAPGVFLPIRLDPTNNQGECDKKGGGGPAGASTYRKNICACNGQAISINDSIPIQPGNMVGPTEQGVEELISKDVDAVWDDVNNKLDSPLGLSSPRVVKMALISPAEITGSGMQTVRVRNFGQFFIEGIVTEGTVARVTGRFMYYIDGLAGGPDGPTSSLVKTLRLVE